MMKIVEENAFYTLADEAIIMMKMGPLTIKFDKVNGVQRIMRCTLNKELIESITKIPYVAKEPKSSKNISVFDLDIKEWRSFRPENLQTISMTVDQLSDNMTHMLEQE